MALERSVAARRAAKKGRAKHKQADGLSVAERKLRKRRRADAERLVELAEHLPAEESELIRSVYDRGLTAVELARLAHVPARTLQRRVQVLTLRMASPLFAYVVRHRCRWPALRRDIGDQIVVRGKSMRSTSKLLGVSLHQVRRELDRIRAEAEARGEGPGAGDQEPEIGSRKSGSEVDAT